MLFERYFKKLFESTIIRKSVSPCDTIHITYRTSLMRIDMRNLESSQQIAPLHDLVLVAMKGCGFVIHVKYKINFQNSSQFQMSLKDGININFSDIAQKKVYSSYQKPFCRPEWASQNLDQTYNKRMRHPLSFSLSLSLSVCLCVCMYVSLSIFLCDKVLLDQFTYLSVQMSYSSEQILIHLNKTLIRQNKQLTHPNK